MISENLSLTGQVALVTGAGRGIGRAVALALAAAGADVVLTARTQAELEETVELIKRQDTAATLMAGDLTDEAFVKRLFEQISQQCGRLDVLVNNAGWASFGPIEEYPVADFRRTMEINVVAPFLTMQAAIPLMRAGGGGRIINIGSVRSHWTEFGDAGAYNASKFALRAMTESVARQLHSEECIIGVGMVCPGAVDTTLTNPNREPRPQWLSPEQVAQAVLHAVTAPPGVNFFDTVLFSMSQRPW